MSNTAAYTEVAAASPALIPSSRPRLRFWLPLAPFAIVALCANVVAISQLGREVHRAPIREASLVPRAAASSNAPQPVLLGDARAPQPDLADYNTITTERDGLARVATLLLSRISSCERSVADPYGAGLTVLNQCLSVPVRENIMRARFEPVLILSALRNLRQGACMNLTAALMSAVSELGAASSAWSGDVGDPGASAGRRERSDVKDLRLIAGGILALTHARGWRTACRPRPYDSTEHQGARARRAAVKASQLAL